MPRIARIVIGTAALVGLFDAPMDAVSGHPGHPTPRVTCTTAGAGADRDADHQRRPQVPAWYRQERLEVLRGLHQDSSEVRGLPVKRSALGSCPDAAATSNIANVTSQARLRHRQGTAAATTKLCGGDLTNEEPPAAALAGRRSCLT